LLTPYATLFPYTTLFRSYTQPISEHWQSKFASLLNRLPLRKPVKLLESSVVKVPMVIGFFKPVILMPVGAVNGLSEKEVEAILRSEEHTSELQSRENLVC